MGAIMPGISSQVAMYEGQLSESVGLSRALYASKETTTAITIVIGSQTLLGASLNR
jgi:hypothetical protein